MKYFPCAIHQGEETLETLAQKISSASSLTEADCFGVMYALSNAKRNLSTTKGLTVAMIGEAQALSEKLNNAKNLLVPLDAYLKKP